MSGILICDRCRKEIALRAFGLKCGCKDEVPSPTGISGILEVRNEQELEKRMESSRKWFVGCIMS